MCLGNVGGASGSFFFELFSESCQNSAGSTPTCPKHILGLLGAHTQLFLRFFELFAIFTIVTKKTCSFQGTPNTRFFAQNQPENGQSRTKAVGNPSLVSVGHFKNHSTPPGHILGLGLEFAKNPFFRCSNYPLNRLSSGNLLYLQNGDGLGLCARYQSKE